MRREGLRNERPHHGVPAAASWQNRPSSLACLPCGRLSGGHARGLACRSVFASASPMGSGLSAVPVSVSGWQEEGGAPQGRRGTDGGLGGARDLGGHLLQGRCHQAGCGEGSPRERGGGATPFKVCWLCPLASASLRDMSEVGKHLEPEEVEAVLQATRSCFLLPVTAKHIAKGRIHERPHVFLHWMP